jgi:hypothetical protein
VDVKDPGWIPELPGLLLGTEFASSLESGGCGGGCAAAFFFPDAAATFVGHPTGAF